MGMLNAGELNQRITLQRVTVTSDGQGGKDESWAAFAAPWANVLPTRGQETLGGTEVTATLATDLLIRFRTDVDATQRVILGDRTLEIQSLSDPDGRREALKLTCVEITP